MREFNAPNIEKQDTYIICQFSLLTPLPSRYFNCLKPINNPTFSFKPCTVWIDCHNSRTRFWTLFPLGGVLADRFSRKIFPPLSMLIMGCITLIMGLFGGISIYLFVSCLLKIAIASVQFHSAGMNNYHRGNLL